MKICRECGEEKPLTEFYKHAQMADGRLNRCKECVKGRVKDHRSKNLERVREYDRIRGASPRRVAQRKLYSQTESGKKAIKSARKRWGDRNKDKKRAHSLVAYHIKTGGLARCPCEVCGTSIRVEAHHDDYSKPLAVRWLCSTHHAQWHKNEREKDRNTPFLA